MTQKDKRDLILLVILTLLIGLLCCSCRCTKTGVTELIRTDTIRDTQIITEYATDTVYLEIPAQAKERETRDSTSYLETDYAESTARINPNGTLFHELNNKAGKKAHEVQTKTVTKTISQNINNNLTRTVTLKERLSLWKQMAIRLFPWLLAVIFALCLYVFRKPFWKLLSRLLT